MENPLVSIIVITYNQEQFIVDAVNSALNQEYENVEIIISDDNSTDNTFFVINQTVKGYNGNHKIVLNKNKNNLGLIEHLNYCVFELSKGDIIVIQAGDDISVEQRTGKIVDYFIKNQDVYAVCSNAIVIDQNGRHQYKFKASMDIEKRGIFDALNKGNQVFGAAAAYHRRVFTRFSKIMNIIRNEDMILPLRAALIGKIGYIDENLIYYRNHGENLSFWVKMQRAGISERRELEIKSLKNILNNLLCLKMDAEKISANESVMELINLKISKANLKYNLFKEQSIHHRLKILLNSGIYTKQFVLLAISPKFYQRITRFRNRNNTNRHN